MMVFRNEAHLRRRPSSSPSGMGFVARGASDGIHRISMVGRFNVYNALWLQCTKECPPARFVVGARNAEGRKMIDMGSLSRWITHAGRQTSSRRCVPRRSSHCKSSAAVESTATKRPPMGAIASSFSTAAL